MQNRFYSSTPGKFIFILIILAGFGSCVDKLDIEIPVSNSKLVLFGDLSPDKAIVIDLSTSATVNSGQRITWPEDAVINFAGPGIFDGKSAFSFDPEISKYVYNDVSFHPREGSEYFISISIPDTDLETISSSTRVPRQIEIQDYNIVDHKVRETAQGLSFIYDLRLVLQESKNKPSFVRLSSNYQRKSYVLNMGTDTSYTDEIFEDFTIVEVLKGKNAATVLFHQNSIVVDLSRLEGNEIVFRISYRDNIPNSARYSQYIQIILDAINMEMYQYHITLSKQIESNNNPFVSPVMNYSNVENGLGVFGAHHTLQKTIKVR